LKATILLLGNIGQVGWELNRSLITLGKVIALDYPQINMADVNSIRTIVDHYQPNIIVNATAYTDVEKAESQPELASVINGIGPGILAEMADKRNSFLIHYSTDYVFDGTKQDQYREEDQPSPINVYGETKLAGEKLIQNNTGSFLIFRTSWVYSHRRPCFVTKVRQWAAENEILNIVEDQISSPTSSRTLAEVTAQIIAQGKGDILNYLKENAGIYHLTDSGFCNRYEWAKAIIELTSGKYPLKVRQMNPVKSSHFATVADRPARSILSCEKLTQNFNTKLPDWYEALSLKMAEFD
jgi:dTDP-4-dehydrorhamnose reductase